MSYASVEDVSIDLGRPSTSSEEADQWQAWLDRVERAIGRGFRRVGLTLAEQIALDDPTEQDVIDVEVAAVVRKIQNPTWGETSYTKSLDDGSITRRREGGDGGDPLTLLDAEWAALVPTRRGGARAFSIMPS